MQVSTLGSALLVLLSAFHALATECIGANLLKRVETDKGAVIGKTVLNSITQRPYTTFKGIPYAKPPLGDRRFQKAEEMDNWSHDMMTIDHKDICIQQHLLHAVGSEDCLYLNVYTPKTNFQQSSCLKPVMIYIHGGAYTFGSGNSEEYGPDLIVVRDVVLVTFNYRLGAFGFLNLNHEKAPGNAGLKDQVMVMQWVQRNIRQFGGDPTNVTLVGQSSGAACVDLHLISDMSKGLFHRSISMSGSVFNPWAFHDNKLAERHAYKLAKKLKNGKLIGLINWLIFSKDKALRVLQTAPPEDVVKIAMKINLFELNVPFAPSPENPNLPGEHFLEECFVKKFKDNKFQALPHLMGYVDLEIWSFRKYIFLDDIIAILQQKHNIMNAILAPITGNKSLGIIDKIKNLKRQKLKFISEILFESGIDLKQKMMTANGNSSSVYYYYFTYDPNGYKHLLEGSGHSDDLSYLFYLPKETNLAPKLYENNSKHYSMPALVRKNMTLLWTNFVKYGDPTHTTASDKKCLFIKWNKSNETGNYLKIGETLTMRSGRPIRGILKKYQQEQENEYRRGGCVDNVMGILKNIIKAFIH